MSNTLHQSHFSKLRASWADFVLFGKAVDFDLLQNPLCKAHPLSEILAYLLSKPGTRPLPAFEIKNLNLAERCQIAILQAIGGAGGETLARKLLPLCSFPSLWSQEHLFHAKEAKCSLLLLQKAFGKEAALAPDADPFFYALEKKLPRWQENPLDIKDHALADLHLEDGIESAFPHLGEGISVGAIKTRHIEIPAFGPHIYPFSDSKLFGMYKATPDQKWAATAARKEVWFETILDLNKKMIETRFIGLKSSDPIFFVFYIKADLARIDAETYTPKSLRRFSGKAQAVSFERQGDQLTISSAATCKMELIPLAGEGCFWGSDFLLAFEIPFHEGRGVFHLAGSFF